MADIDYTKMQDAFERALRARGYSGGGSGGGTGSGGGSGSTPSVDPTKLKDALDKAGDGVGGFVEEAKKSTDTFRGLSKAGSNFSNDIIGMNVAAAQSRLSLGEFADVVAQNGKNLAGLGGSVTRGSEAFAKASKGFFESDFTTRLQEMGFTAKDLNETLAVQLGTQRATFKDTEEGRKKAYESAASLAKEMDMIAKLTGKNREQQMEEAKKRSTDGQIEAKLRLIGIEQGAEAEAKAREAFQKQFAEAEARGMGQMAKEMFATGTLTSQEAATQYALLGEAAQKTGEQMQHLSKGNVAAAEAASKQADAANAKNQRDPTLLRLATLGDAAGTAGSIMKKNVEDNMALHDSVMAVSKSMKPGLLTSTEDFGKALTKVRNDIEASRMGLDARGRQVSGATQGVVAAQRAGQEIRAGVAGAAEAENAQGESVAGAARRAGQAAATALNRAAGPGNTLGGNIERAAERGQQPETVTPRPGEGKYQLEKRQEEAAGGIIGAGTKGASEIANATATALEKITMKVQVVGVPKYAEGGVAEQPQIAMVGEAGPETIIPNKDIDNVIMTALKSLPMPAIPKTTGSDEMSDFAKGMTDFVQKSTQSLNLKEISKEISTTISSTTGGGATTVKGPDITELSKNFEKPFADFTSDFDGMLLQIADDIGEALPIEAFDQNQAALEFATKRRQELEDLMNDGMARSGAEWDEIFDEAEQLDGQIESLTNKQLDAMTAYSDGWGDIDDITNQIVADIGDAVPIDEFGDIEEAMKRAAENMYPDTEFGDLEGAMAKQSTKAINPETGEEYTPVDATAKSAPVDLAKINLPGFSNQLKTAQASIPAAIKADENQSAAETRRLQQAKTESKPTEQAKTENKPTAPGKEKATLDDVVINIQQLNKTMSQLLAQHEDLGNKQVKATRANNSNVLAR